MAVRPETSPASAHAARRDEITRAALRRTTSPSRVLTRALPALLLIDSAVILAASALAARLTLSPLPLREITRSLAPAACAAFAVMAAGFVFLAFLLGIHRLASGSAPDRRRRLAMQAVGGSFVGAVAVTLLFAIEASAPAGRALTAVGLWLGVLGLAATPAAARLVARLASGGSRRRTLVVGGGPDGLRLSAQLDWDERHRLDVVGLADLSARASASQTAPGRTRFRVRDRDDIPGLAVALAVDEVVLCTGEIGRKDAVVLAGQLAEEGIATFVTPPLDEMFVSGAPVRWPGSVPLLKVGGQPIGKAGRILKRAADLVVALLGLLVLFPLMLLITLAVRFSSPGPVLHSQTRVGREGRRFQMYKFRSMVVAGDDSRYRRYVASLVTHGDAAGVDGCGRPLYKIVDDPRITPIGRLIRRMSIDELPQLLNVVKGEMSLVGPRPPLPFEYDLYEDWQRRRLRTTPGMTGLWQVSGRSLLSFEDMVLLDLYYASNWSFLLDLELIWRTIPEVLHARGAR